MANRFPLIVDVDDGNRIKELPSGDNLNLQGSNIVNATNIASQSITLNGTALNNFDGVFANLTGKPTTTAGYGITDAFSGAYSDLTGKPTIPATIQDLSNVASGTPNNNQILKYNSGTNQFEFADEQTSLALNNLSDVVVSSPQTNHVVQWNGATFTNSFVDYNALINKPTFVSQGDTFTGDHVGSVFTDNSTLVVDGITGNLTGNLTGNVTGDVTGDVTGNVTGDLTGDVTGNTTGYHTGDVTGSVFADDSALMLDAVNNVITATDGVFTNVKGSLLTSGGAIIIDGTGAGSIPDTVTVDKLDDFITDFKAATAAATDLADFQTRIAALAYP